MTVCLPITAYFLSLLLLRVRIYLWKNNNFCLLIKDFHCLPIRPSIGISKRRNICIAWERFWIQKDSRKKANWNPAGDSEYRASVVSLKVTDANSSKNFPRENPLSKSRTWSIASHWGLIQPAFALDRRRLAYPGRSYAGDLASWADFGIWFVLKRRGNHSLLPTRGSSDYCTDYRNRLGTAYSISVLVSQMARVPTVLGWLRPVILLPVGILGEMSPEQLEMILAHQLAHIRRYGLSLESAANRHRDGIILPSGDVVGFPGESARNVKIAATTRPWCRDGQSADLCQCLAAGSQSSLPAQQSAVPAASRQTADRSNRRSAASSVRQSNPAQRPSN